MPDPPSVRVRFAPSPTGFLHVGGLRTALYNFLFARHHGGVFILRIEDTDQSRFVEGAADNLRSTLEWIGLSYDEGPGKGGSAGPYVQSERLPIYSAHAERLLALDKCYRCFCTPEELEEMRRRQIAEKKPPMYDRRCRSLGREEIDRRMAEGRPFVLRMKIPLFGELAFHDLIRGEITIGHRVLDDQVLVKSDGFPTYHLANVVDDHLMGITHVIRGEEWLPSTPKHILLYEAFGWAPPAFAHLPLLLNRDRSKLSKRQGDVAVEEYRAKGYLPEALLNFVALLGWNTPDEQEMFSLGELIGTFSLERVGKAGAVFDIEKLNWMNAQYLKRLPPEELTERCLPYLRQAGFDVSDPARARAVVEAVSSHLTSLGSVAEHAAIFFAERVEFESEEARIVAEAEGARRVYASFLAAAGRSAQWSREAFKAMMKETQQESGMKGKDLFMPVRVALTGRMHGPELPLVAEALGRAECIARVRARMPIETARRSSNS